MTTPQPQQENKQEWTIPKLAAEARLYVDNMMPTTYCLGCMKYDLGFDESGSCPNCQSKEVEESQKYVSWLITELETKAQELALQRSEYENALNEVIELLEEQMDDEPCSYDHQGYCQTHWGGTDEDPTFCGMKKSKKVIQKCKALLQKGVK